MKNLQSFGDFVNESVVNENIRKKMPEFLEKIKKAEEDFPKTNKRSRLLKDGERNKKSQTFDQDTKFTYSPDGEIFVVYGYANQGAVDNFLYKGKGDGDKAKENLTLARIYAETGRPGYRVNQDGSKDKIGKDGYIKY